MADDRKDEAKAPHWTSAQLTEASAQPHPPEIKDQGGAGEGLVRSANGFPYREDEEGAFGEGLLKKAVMLAKSEGKRRGRQTMKWLNNIPDPTDLSLSKLQKIVKDSENLHSEVHGITKS